MPSLDHGPVTRVSGRPHEASMRWLLAGLGASLSMACESSPEAVLVAPTITVVSFNSGTTEGLGHDGVPDDGYGSEEAALSDMYYGDGLAWQAAIDDTRTFFAALDPDIVVFQEIFFSGECETVPEPARAGFVCETWRAGDPTVAQLVLGEGWQVACHLGKPDKCAAVNRRLGTFVGCDADLCLDGLDGGVVADCGGGSRIGRGVIELASGGTLTLVNVHGSSGIEQADRDCRVKQFEQVFDDLGDGAPAANGDRNLIMGDLNTDPGRLTDFDESAVLFADRVSGGERFHFISDVGPDATPSYAALFNIDHVVSDALDGSCVYPGVTEGQAPVTDMVYFDHKPVVCQIDVP